MAFAGLAVAGCGGGGGGGGNAAAPAPPAPTATATVTVTPKGPVTAAALKGEAFTATLEGTWQGTNLAAGTPVYLRVVDRGDTFQMPAPQPAAANGTFRFQFAPNRELWTGDYVNQFEITPCVDAQCAKTFGAPVRVDYTIDISTLGEWETLMRDATHASFVPTRIDPLELKVMWEWETPQEPDAVENFIGRPTTTNGSLMVIAGSMMPDGTERGVALYQINEGNGVSRWNVPVPAPAHAVAPASNGSLVYLTTLGVDHLMTALDGQTGGETFRYAQATDPLGTIIAPTNLGGTLYTFAGHHGEEIHAVNAWTGARQWSKPRVGLQSATPTADYSHVYYQAGGTIEVLESRTGDTVASIVDPMSDGTAPRGSTAVVLGSRGGLIVRSFRAMSGGELSGFSIAERRWLWSTANTYGQFFAVADGVIYAFRNGTTLATIDAIDETNGHILWSWTSPALDQQSRPSGNMMATRGMVFFGTENPTSGTSFTWAIDTEKRDAVWRYPGAGYVLMSGNRTLYQAYGPAGGLMNRVRAFRTE